MPLSDKVITATKRVARVFYVSRETVKFWNSRRDIGEPQVFCGWYWSKGEKEGGPFKSSSAAWRDAYYLAVLKEAPPALARDRHRAEAEAAKRNAANPMPLPKRRVPIAAAPEMQVRH